MACAMAQPLTSLIHDDSRYLKAFQLFLERSSEHKCMRDFIHHVLPDVLSRRETKHLCKSTNTYRNFITHHSTLEGLEALTHRAKPNSLLGVPVYGTDQREIWRDVTYNVGNGKSHLNVIGVGSGSGELDLEMLSMLHTERPGVTVDNEVVEPNSQQLLNYKVMVSQKPDLDYINFTWNKMTASEFEEHCRVKKLTKKADFIHLIQMLYYAKDPGATINFFQSLLDKNGTLIIVLVSGESGWGKLWRTYKDTLCYTEISQYVTTGDIKSLLDSKGVRYQNYELPSQMDITECFTEGDEKGELLLDFLTEVLDFSKRASPELKDGVLKLLRHPDCSVESDGKVLFNNNLGVIVIKQLP